MKVKRVKHARKYLTLFRNSFGIFEPYQVLVDGTFCQAALQTKIQIKEQLPKYLDGSIQLLTTRCVIEEGKALGPQLAGAVLIAKRFQLRKCAHHKAAVPAAECILSMIGADNPNGYFVASQDRALRSRLQKVPGVPLLFINRNTILLEKPSTASHQASDKVQMSRLQPSTHEKETLEKLSDATTELKRRKRKRPGGPNPLSMLKSKRKRDDKHKTADDTKKKRIRKRKRRSLASHVQDALQQHTTTCAS
ncbi:Small subunit processome component [Desmophyllum pertusum]|uniref:rRNA-processing protein UTP23 homolog n=1 Tax=Desmophyllum pertusum TaxID=174260 RepID=A0A9W9ZD27_9CNID|nr:Small subunit processome component [Desmophyllum pertusum]